MLNRREALGCFTSLACALSAPTWAQDISPSAASNDFWKRPRRLRLTHQLSRENASVTYWSDGQVLLPGYQELSIFMRDRHVNKAVYMDPTVLDILYAVQGWLDFFDVKHAMLVNSGYRDPSRNSRIEGAAKNSLHTLGRACDISIPGISTTQIAKFGQWLGGGGVGWYPSKGFIHLDTGRIRSWRG